MVTLDSGAGVVISAISGAGSSVGSLNVAGAFTSLSGSLPMSDTEQAATMLAVRLGAAAQVYAQNLATLSDSIGGAQALLSSTDSGVGQRFGMKGFQAPTGALGPSGATGGRR